MRYGRRAALALLGAALLAGAQPGEVSGLLAWVALAPLVVAVDGCAPPAAAALGLLAGAASALLAFRWIFAVPGFGAAPGAVLALWLALFPAAWCAAVAALERRRWPVLAAAPLLWAGQEWLRGHAGFLALPWGTLAQTQHANLPLLQVAAVAGEPGVSFVVAAAGVALGRLATVPSRREAFAAAALVAVAHAGGAIRLASAGEEGERLRVAVVQPAILPAERSTPEGYASTLDRLEALTREAARSRPALVVWPETAVRGLPGDAALRGRVERIARDAGAPILAGSSSTEKLLDAGGGAPGMVRGNDAVLVPAGAAPAAVYRKTLLVPFVEAVPGAGRIAWPAWLVGRTHGLAAGDGPRTLLLPGGIPFAPLICWESLFPDYVRRAVAGGARLVVLVTNDVWAGASAAPEQHAAAAVLRAVETGVPVVVASNGGPSLIVDGFGRELARSPGGLARATLAAEVPLGGGHAPRPLGGWLALLAAAGALGAGAGFPTSSRRTPARGSRALR